MKSFASTVLQYTIRVLIIEFVVVLLVGGILLFREHSLSAFGDWMMWAGIIIVVVGLLSVVGYGGATRSGSYPVARTVGERDIPDQTRADLDEEAKTFSFLILALGVGVLAIVISELA